MSLCYCIVSIHRIDVALFETNHFHWVEKIAVHEKLHTEHRAEQM